jgi:hypothetical protein
VAAAEIVTEPCIVAPRCLALSAISLAVAGFGDRSAGVVLVPALVVVVAGVVGDVVADVVVPPVVVVVDVGVVVLVEVVVGGCTSIVAIMNGCRSQ